MTTADLLAVGATLAGLAMAVSPILQIRRMRRTRSSNDVSLLYLALLDAGFVLWVAYGVAISNYVVAGTNTASLVVMSGTILVALAYRRGGARRAAAGLAAETGSRATTPSASGGASDDAGAGPG